MIVQKRAVWIAPLISLCIVGSAIFSLNLFLHSPQSFTIRGTIWRGGTWQAEGIQSVDNKTLSVDVTLSIDDKVLSDHAPDEDEISALLVLERLFAQNGKPNAINNEYFSTVLTPGGLPIEFSAAVFGAPSQYNVHGDVVYTTPIDTLLSISIKSLRTSESQTLSPARFSFREDISSIQEGSYRPIIYFFYTKKGTPDNQKAKRENTLALLHQILFPIQENFTERNPPWGGVSSYASARDQINYLPLFTVGKPQTPKMPWVLFADVVSQGTKGMVSKEDSKQFQISTREVQQAKLILEPGMYSLNPALPLVALFDQKLNLTTERIPLQKTGYMEGSLLLPDGSVQTIGRKVFTDFKTIGEGDLQTGQRIAWRSMYAPDNTIMLSHPGEYQLVLQGKVYDIYGNIYDGGGTYTFYVGNKLTFSSAVKPGTSFYVGDAYIPRYSYYPPLLGKATMTYSFYPFDKTIPPEIKVIEKENLDGTFNDTPRPFTTAGEYHVSVQAEAHHIIMGDFYGTYTSDGIVVPQESNIALHGRMGGKFFDNSIDIDGPRFNVERYPLYEPLREWSFPYLAGDILKVAANGKNVISPQVDLFDINGNKILITPLGKNNLQPFNYPEQTDEMRYLSITSEKAGMVVRSFIGTSFLDNTFWNIKNNDFGNRLNASKQGDLENDVYRNFASAVIIGDNAVQATNYVSNISVLPGNATDDRVIEPFSEPFVVTGGKEHLFVVGTGLQKLLGAPFNQYLHIFPAVEGVQIDLTLTKPDGTKKVFPPVFTDPGGFTPAGESTPCDQPGVYRVDVTATYKGKTDKDFYKIFVPGKEATPLVLGILPMSTFSSEGVIFNGLFPERAKNISVDYEVIMPGAIMDTDEIGIGDYQQSANGFSYHFSPTKLNAVYKNFEINPLARMAFMYFHTQGAVDGKLFEQLGVVMVRGDQMYYLGIPPPPNV